MALTPIGLIRKLGKLARGGVTPLQVLLGCLLGVMLGMVPGFNMTMLLGIVLLVLLNANGGMAALGFALGKALCLLMAPVTFQIGYFLIHRIGLEGLFRAAGDTPVVALMDLHYYCLVGGLPVGLLVGLAMGLGMAKLVQGVRKGILAVVGEQVNSAPALHDRPMKLTVTRDRKVLALLGLDYSTPEGRHQLALLDGLLK